jgi:hypothetical protein
MAIYFLKYMMGLAKAIHESGQLRAAAFPDS